MNLRAAVSIAALTALAAAGTGCGGSSDDAATQASATTVTKTPPKITIVHRAGPDVAPGDVFLAPKLSTGGGGPLIVDNEGNTVWYKPAPAGQTATDFRVQTYHGKPVLTWWQGTIGTGKNGLPQGVGHGVGMIYSAGYEKVAEVHAGDGAHADLHEFFLTDKGTALVTAYVPVKRDLSSIGGPKDGTVLDSEVQEIDVKTGKVLFEWKSLDHVGIDQSYAKIDSDHPDAPFDYFHINAIQPLPNGNLLVSGRNTWTVYEIDGKTGDIVWRLGGKQSDFDLGPGVRFAWQHDARLHPDGTLTMFDNESMPKVRDETRGLVLNLDMKAMKATVARTYTHPDPLLSGYEGSFQELGNGDVLMGWGAEPYVSEFSHDGKLVFDLKLPKGWDTYRASRFPWPPAGK